MSKKSIVEEIYKAPAEKLPRTAEKAINEAVVLLENYAKNIVENTDIFHNKWILLNLLHVLYKYIFLLQTEDLEMISTAHPKKLDANLSDKCIICNKTLSHSLERNGVSDDERIKGVCLDCFISVVQEGNWWRQSWLSVENGIKK